MKFRLVFPPVWLPLRPYMSLPCLIAYLRKQGVDCEPYDLNLEFFDYILSKQYIRHCTQLLAGEVSSGKAAYYTYLAENVEACKATIRSDAAMDPDVYKSCYALLNGCLRLVKRSWGTNESFHFNGYSNKAYNISRSIDLQRCVQDVFSDSASTHLSEILERFVAPIVDNADIIGFSVCAPYSQMLAAYTMAALCKKYKPSIKIVIGGSAITSWAAGNSLTARMFDAVDYYSFYEGEVPLTMLCRYLSEDPGVSLCEIPGLAYLSDGKVVMNPYDLSVDINSLPTPEYDIKNLHRYFSPTPVISLYTSRSCFWNRCAFCSQSIKNHDSYRQRSLDRIIEDLETYYRKYGIRYYEFVDEAVSAATYRNISQRIIDKNIDIRWRGYARLDKTMTPEILELAYKAGLRRLHFGLESYNERILKLMNKGIFKRNVLPILQASARAGIWNHVFLICGFPTETPEEFDESYYFVKENRDCIHSVSCAPFSLLLFSAVASHPEEFGVRLIVNPENDLAGAVRFKTLIGEERDSFIDAAMAEKMQELEKMLSLNNTDLLKYNDIVFADYSLQQRRLSDTLGDDYADSDTILLYAADGNPTYAEFRKDTVKPLPDYLVNVLMMLRTSKSKKEITKTLEEKYGYPATVVERFLSEL